MFTEMFPDKITIYHHDIVNNEDVYQKTTVNGFYWNESTALDDANKGIKSKKQVTIISSPENAHTYGSEWTVCIDDVIVKGKGGAITSLKEVENGVTVKGVAVNVCNSDVDNIVITGV